MPLQTGTGGGLSGLLSTIGDLADQGANVYRSVTGGSSPSSPPPAAPASAPAPATNSWTKYLPWAIGGVVLLVVLGFVMPRK